MNPLRGRALVEIIPCNYNTRPSGLLIINRKEVSTKGKVLSVGETSMDRNFNNIFAPCDIGDTIHFKKYTPMVHRVEKRRMKEGKVTLWWEDIVAVETQTAAGWVNATFDNILVKCIYKQVSSTIFLPETIKKKEYGFHGRVVAVGPDYKYDVKVGDKIIFPRHEGFPFVVEDEEYLCLKAKWILGVINEPHARNT